MAKRVRRQHVVPRFYLNGFANDAGRVRRVTLPGEPAHVLSTGDAGVVKDFYTVTFPDGTQSDMFEKAFSEVEGPASEAFRAILAGEWPPSEDHRAVVATWVALQHLRGEDIRAHQGQMSGEFIRLVVGTAGKAALRELIEQAEARVVSDDELDAEWQDITKPGGPDLEVEVHEHMRLLMSLLEPTAAYLHDCHWVLHVFSRRSIITSDHPVSLIVDENYPEWQGIGIATADLFLVPLARRAALAIQPRGRLRERYGDDRFPDYRNNGTTRLANSINQETAARARRYLYHHPDDSPLDRLYLPEPDTKAGPQMSGGSDLIREEGLFSDSPRSKRPPSSDLPGPSSDRGVSIRDLPWPIPGRRARPS